MTEQQHVMSQHASSKAATLPGSFSSAKRELWWMSQQQSIDKHDNWTRVSEPFVMSGKQKREEIMKNG